MQDGYTLKAHYSPAAAARNPTGTITGGGQDGAQSERPKHSLDIGRQGVRVSLAPGGLQESR